MQTGLSMFLSEDNYTHVIFCLGTNDVGKGILGMQTVHNLQNLIDIVMDHCSSIQVFVFNLSEFSLEHQLDDCEILDVMAIARSDRDFVAEDRVHLNKFGQKFVRRQLTKLIGM